MLSFLEIRLVDVIDIIVSAYLMFVVYRMIRGTMAANIVLSILAFLVFWVVVRALNMNMLSAVFSSFVNIGLLALIVIFQQEIRNSLVMLSAKHTILKKFGIDKLVQKDDDKTDSQDFVTHLVVACENMSEGRTGALIVVQRSVGLNEYISTGEPINSQVSALLLETIFFKNTPLHDGAVIIDKLNILAASCILPVSKSTSIPKSFGLRHRSAMGISEVSDAVAIVVSEETGTITIFEGGEYVQIFSPSELKGYLERI